jgi:hypothetical protein
MFIRIAFFPVYLYFLSFIVAFLLERSGKLEYVSYFAGVDIYEPRSVLIYLYAFLSIIFVYLSWYVSYRLFNRVRFAFRGVKSNGMPNFTFIILALAVLHMSTTASLGYSGVVTSFNYVLSFLQPTYLVVFALYLFFDHRKWGWWLILIVYCISAYFTGFMSYYIYLIPLAFMILNLKLKHISMLIMSFILIILSGFMRYWKYLVSNSDIGFDFEYMITNYLHFVYMNVARIDFSSAFVSLTYYRAEFIEQYSNHYMAPYNSGYLFSLFTRALTGENAVALPAVWNEIVFGSEGSNFFPLINYLLIDFSEAAIAFIMVFLSILIGTFFVTFLCRLYNAPPYLAFFYGFFLVIVVPQGWFWSLFGFIQALVVYSLLSIFYLGLKKVFTYK